MSFLEQLHSLIINKNLASTPAPRNIYRYSNSVSKFWFSRLSEQQRKFLISGILLGLGYYILSPSISIPYLTKPKEEMFSKRPDKYTTGLINLRNDCFANSSLQAYLALPGLTEYLNSFIGAFNQLREFMEANEISELVQVKSKDGEDGSKSKSNSKFDIPLHYALSRILKKLQETRMTSRTISVWTFLHSLEKIFNAKISKSQHDAHELTQLINETLENENVKILKKYRQLKSELQNNADLLNTLDEIDLPEFPFSGLILSQMKCLSCSFVSKPHFSPFLMLTLHTPEKLSTELDTILDESESESIEGYQCLKCRLVKIIDNENYLKDNGKSNNDDTEIKFISDLVKLNSDNNLCINEDLPKGLEEYIKSYNKYGLDISNVTSTVFRKQQILKPPKIFGVHLSRSSFNGVNVTRNSCHVSFKDQLALSIGKEYHNELKQFQNLANEDDMDGDTKFNSNVLTHDENDMEDEDVQREDIDENGNEEDDHEESTTSDNVSDDDVSDNSSLASIETSRTATTISQSRDRQSLKNSDLSNSTTLKAPETLNNAPITEDQTDNLKWHFKSFKFNENDIYKYKLKAVIRHQGSHTQGHYECYKRKPLYVKDKDGVIFKLSPEISDEIADDIRCDVTKVSDPETSNLGMEEDPLAQNRKKKFSFSFNNNRRDSVASSGSDSGDPHSHSNNRNGSEDIHNLRNIHEEEIEDTTSGLRRKFSTMMGRRPSVFQTDPANANIQEIIPSGLTTPAELIVENPETDYFSKFSASSQETAQPNKEEPKKVKMRKIPTLIKNPFWRISDSQITEVSRASVLCETSSVYMLYYERVDRKQIKSDE